MPIPKLQNKAPISPRYPLLLVRHSLLLSVCHVPRLPRLDIVHDLRPVEDCVPLYYQ